MRAATLMTMFVAPLALAGCDGGEKAVETEDLPMSNDMPMQRGEGGQTASADGTVTAVNAEAGTITIAHGPVAGVDWPAMTMAFQADETMRGGIAVGDEVSFEFRTSDAGSRLTSISKK